MKKDKFLFLSLGFLIGIILSINLINLISIMDDAIYMKDHIFILGDLLPGKMDNKVALELTISKGSAWKIMDTIILSQWISAVSMVVYWLSFITISVRRFILNK